MELEIRSRPQAVLIAGPTASGKSGLALDMAKRLEGEIVNTDSMQVYDTLRILTARPGPGDEKAIPHHLYGHVPAAARYSAARWLDDVAPVLQDLRKRDVVPIFAGGTGLYFQALEGGLARVPAIDPDLRARIRNELRDAGSRELYRRLSLLDPAGAGKLRDTDGQRIARALEVIEQTGRPLASFHAQADCDSLLRGFEVKRFLVMPDRAVLHERINARAQTMVEGGVIDEVRRLLDMDLPVDATAMKAIGVAQIAGFLNGVTSKEEMLERLRAATRQYAKRQSTWFRGQTAGDWTVLDDL